MTLRLNIVRWLLTLVGAQFLCAVVWVLGPLLPPLEPSPVRLALVSLGLLAWAAANATVDWRHTRREAVLAAGLTGAAQDEAQAVQVRLTKALELLRKAKGRRFAITDQPWYAIIGPPGAGKTTALLNVGLDFPLAGELGPGAVSGVGGTRLCEWWFTDAAVLIDTAGRYTTQDSNEAVDRAGWRAFLGLLKATRPRQPLNGILVAVAIDELASPDRSVAHANAVRGRVDELDDAFGLRLPVYVLLTKADLLAGFTEFFDDLDRPGREQIWGVTLAMDQQVQPGLLAPLLDQLNRRLYGRLDAEPDGERRASIATFPAQLASAGPQLDSFLTRAFGADAAGRKPLLRGVYLTSGTQEGTPIDRLTGGLARAFGLDRRPAATPRPEAGRAYFLADLLKQVVLPEAMLVSFRPGAARRRALVRMAALASCLLAACAGSFILLERRAAAARVVAAAEAAFAGQAEIAKGLDFDRVADSDFAAILPLLASAEPPPATVPAQPRASDALRFSQDDKLKAAREVVYRHVLEYALLPRLVWRAEVQVRGLIEQPDALYEATRTYLMLGGAGPVDPPSLQQWFVRDWAATLPGPANGPAREQLARSLAAMLSRPLPPVALDGPLVEQARASITRVPLARRAYGRIKPLVDARAIPGWVPAKPLGPAGVGEFVRRSGRGLELGVGGFFTVAGLKTGLLPELPRAAQEAAAESWVTGSPIDPNGAQRAMLEADMMSLYAADYTSAWDDMLNDLDLKPLGSLTQAAQDLYILSSSNSPLRALLASAAGELAPAESLPADNPARARLAVVDDKFHALRALFGSGGAAPIDQVLRTVSDLEQQLAKQAASATKPPPPSPSEDPALALRSEAIRQPQPLSRWLTGLATGAAALRDGGPRGAMVAAWNGGVECAAVVNDRYPFAPAATAEVGLDEFTHLFGPGGVIDAFFNAQLKPYVDMAVRPWKLQPVDGQTAPVTAADLQLFQRAASIRDLFFQADGKQPLVRFDVAPVSSDGQPVRLELGEAQVSTAGAAPGRPAALTWPSRPLSGPARVSVGGAAPATMEAGGPWGLFRLLAQAKIAAAGSRVAFTLDVGGHPVRLDVRATPNPFTPSVLSGFRCPVVQ